MDERRLERALRSGPPFATTFTGVPLDLGARTRAHTWRSRGRVTVVLAVMALLILAILAASLAGSPTDGRLAANGWIAFSVQQDVYLVRPGQEARPISAPDVLGLHRGCPAVSPDGRQLAYGSGQRTGNIGYRDVAVVIADLDARGNLSLSSRIEVGSALTLPCVSWSADGSRLAFGVPLTDTTNPDRTDAGSTVWIATVDDGRVEILSDLLALDLEWSPRESRLAIASGVTEVASGSFVRDGSIRLYDADSRTMRTLVEPSGVTSLTWSPDGARIAFQRGISDGGESDQEISVIGLDETMPRILTSGFSAIFGVGPVWSPDGHQIVYQRMTAPGSEAHTVVLLDPNDGTQVVLPDQRRRQGGADVATWRPSGVTWSPDGRYLLYTAWSHPAPELKALFALPLDGGRPIVLHEGVNGVTRNPSWGSLPED